MRKKKNRYINIFGCDSQYGGVHGAYYGQDGEAPYPPYPGGLGEEMKIYKTSLGEFPANQCWSPVAQPFFSAVFFIFFELIAAFVILSLFVGAVCGGMCECTGLKESIRGPVHSILFGHLSSDERRSPPLLFVLPAFHMPPPNDALARSLLFCPSNVPHPRADEALEQFKEEEKHEKTAMLARIAAEKAEAEENGEAEPKPFDFEVLRSAFEVRTLWSHALNATLESRSCEPRSRKTKLSKSREWVGWMDGWMDG